MSAPLSLIQRDLSSGRDLEATTKQPHFKDWAAFCREENREKIEQLLQMIPENNGHISDRIYWLSGEGKNIAHLCAFFHGARYIESDKMLLMCLRAIYDIESCRQNKEIVRQVVEHSPLTGIDTKLFSLAATANNEAAALYALHFLCRYLDLQGPAGKARFKELYAEYQDPLLSERLLKVACGGDCRALRLPYVFSVLDTQRPTTRALLVELLATRLSQSSSATSLWLAFVQADHKHETQPYALFHEYFAALTPDRFTHVTDILFLFLRFDFALEMKQKIADLCLVAIEKYDIDLPDDLDLTSLRKVPLPYLRRRAPLYGTYQTQNPVVAQTMLHFLANCRLPSETSLSFLCELFTYAHAIRAYRFLDKVEAQFFVKSVDVFDLGPLASLLPLARPQFREKLGHLLVAEAYNSPFRALQNQILTQIKTASLQRLRVQKILERTKQKVLCIAFAKWLCQQVPDVATLDLRDVKVESGAVKALQMGLPKLKHLVMNGEQDLSGVAVSELSLFCTSYESLKSCLELPVKVLHLHDFEYADQILQKLFEHEPKARAFFANLEGFHLEKTIKPFNCENLSDAGASTLLQLTNKLQAMSLNVLSLTNRTLGTIEQHVPQLLSFSSSVSLSKPEHYEQIEAFCKKYSTLQHLALQISYLGEADAMRFAALFHSLSALKSFKVTFVLDDPSLALFVQQHPELTALELVHCAGITDQSLESLASLRQLETLTLQGVKMTPAAIARLVNRLTNLKKLSLQLRDEDDPYGNLAKTLRYRLLRPNLEVYLIPRK